MALIGVVLVMVCIGPVLLVRIFGSGRSSRVSDLIPAAETYFLSCGESMAVVRDVLTKQDFLGCRYRVTYDRVDEGRIQARLYGQPKGLEDSKGTADVLLNMLFHRLESNKTEVEWSFVVMASGGSAAQTIVSLSNSAFRYGLRAAQNSRQSTAEQVLSDEEKKES